MEKDTIIILAAAVIGLSYFSKGAAASVIGEGAGNAVSGVVTGAVKGITYTPYTIGYDWGEELYKHTLQGTILEIKSWGDPNSFWS